MRTRNNSLLPIAAIAGLALTCTPASAESISGTGFSADAIAEKEGATPDEVTDYDGLARWVWAEEGSPSIETTTATVALPDSSDRTFTSDFGTEFQLQPYDQSNILLNDDTFTLDTPAGYTDLQFLILGIGGNTAENFQATVNFSDTSSTVLTFSISDWQGSRDYNARERTAIARRGAGGWASYFGPGVYPREVNFDLSPADQEKVIQSIDFTLADRLAVAALNGATSIPGPAFAITEIVYTPADGKVGPLVMLTWNSSPGQDFVIVSSFDLASWELEIEDGQTDAGATTTRTFDLSLVGLDQAEKLFFRVETP